MANGFVAVARPAIPAMSPVAPDISNGLITARDVDATNVPRSGKTRFEHLVDHTSGHVNVRSYLPAGYVDGVTDATAAIQAAIDAGRGAAVLPGDMLPKVTAPLVIGSGKALIAHGAGQAALKAYHNGPVVTVLDHGTFKGINITADVAYRDTYVGVKLDGHSSSCTHANVEDVQVFFPKTGFWLSGGVYFAKMLGISTYLHHDYGILLDKTEGGASAPNGNTIHFKELPAADNSANWAAVTWEQAGIKLANGASVNTFTGGEAAPNKIGIIAGNGINNVFIGTYGEKQQTSLTTSAGAVVHWLAHSWSQSAQIDDDSKVYGPSGQELGVYNNWYQRTVRGDKGLKALYLFNEGSGDTVIDHSGNARHLRHNVGFTPTWTENGRWGKALQFDPQNSLFVDDVPTAAVDWTQPFTVAMLARVEATWGNSTLLVFRDGAAHYSRVMLNSGFIEVQDSAGGKIATSTMAYAGQDGWAWVILYFDPVNKTISSIDPFFGLTDNIVTPNAPAFSPWATGGGTGINSVAMMRHPSFSQGIKGDLSFVGFWQRKLTWGEALDLVNTKVPEFWPERGLRTVKQLAFARDGSTAETRVVSGTAAPVAGTWRKGDVTLNANPSGGSPFAWRCTTAGTPGTWESLVGANIGYVAPTYGTTVTIDTSLGSTFVITATDTVAFAISDPVGGSSGQQITVAVVNASGGSLGTITFGAKYRLATGGSWDAGDTGVIGRPANNLMRAITLVSTDNSGSAWIEVARTAADVPKP